MVLAMLFLVATFGLNFSIFISTMAVSVFHVEAHAYGLLTSLMAVGSVAGALLSARRARPSMTLLVAGSGVFGLGCAAAALMPGYWLFGAVLVVIGMASQTFMTTANTTVQIACDPPMRGRVMAIYLAIALGSTPLGAPLVGWVADILGPRWALGVGALRRPGSRGGRLSLHRAQPVRHPGRSPGCAGRRLGRTPGVTRARRLPVSPCLPPASSPRRQRPCPARAGLLPARAGLENTVEEDRQRQRHQVVDHPVGQQCGEEFGLRDPVRQQRHEHRLEHAEAGRHARGHARHRGEQQHAQDGRVVDRCCRSVQTTAAITHQFRVETASCRSASRPEGSRTAWPRISHSRPRAQKHAPM